MDCSHSFTDDLRANFQEVYQALYHRYSEKENKRGHKFLLPMYRCTKQNLRQEDIKFEASLSYIERSSLKTSKTVLFFTKVEKQMCGQVL
jgi:hypothetical protein